MPDSDAEARFGEASPPGMGRHRAVPSRALLSYMLGNLWAAGGMGANSLCGSVWYQ